MDNIPDLYWGSGNINVISGELGVLLRDNVLIFVISV